MIGVEGKKVVIRHGSVYVKVHVCRMMPENSEFMYKSNTQKVTFDGNNPLISSTLDYTCDDNDDDDDDEEEDNDYDNGNLPENILPPFDNAAVPLLSDKTQSVQKHDFE